MEQYDFFAGSRCDLGSLLLTGRLSTCALRVLLLTRFVHAAVASESSHNLSVCLCVSEMVLQQQASVHLARARVNKSSSNLSAASAATACAITRLSPINHHRWH